MTGERANVYASLGIREGRHVVMFDSLAEFVETVTNYTMRPEYEARRQAIVRRAQALAFKKFTWAHVAGRLEDALFEAQRKFALR